MRACHMSWTNSTNSPGAIACEDKTQRRRTSQLTSFLDRQSLCTFCAVLIGFTLPSLRGSDSGKALSSQRPTPVPNKPDWTLTFHDEFDGTKLDAKKWLDSYPGGERTHS